MINRILLILLIAFFVALAGLFAGAETGMYQLSRLRLRLGIEKKRLLFVILGRTLRDGPALLISMLIGTNLAYYLTTSIVTFILLSKLQTEHAAELFATLLTAPVLFVFSEVIPKNIFYYRADSLMPFFAPFLFVSHKLFSWSGVVPLLKNLSHLFARLTRASIPSKATITTVPQSHIKAIIQDTSEEAFLGLGVTCSGMQEHSAAIEAFKKVIEINPHHAKAHFLLGVSYDRTASVSNAFKEYKILKNLDADLANKLYHIIFY